MLFCAKMILYGWMIVCVKDVLYTIKYLLAPKNLHPVVSFLDVYDIAKHNEIILSRTTRRQDFGPMAFVPRSSAPGFDSHQTRTIPRAKFDPSLHYTAFHFGKQAKFYPEFFLLVGIKNEHRKAKLEIKRNLYARCEIRTHALFYEN